MNCHDLQEALDRQRDRCAAAARARHRTALLLAEYGDALLSAEQCLSLVRGDSVTLTGAQRCFITIDVQPDGTASVWTPQQVLTLDGTRQLIESLQWARELAAVIEECMRSDGEGSSPDDVRARLDALCTDGPE